MVLNQESGQAIIDMGNVELVELKTCNFKVYHVYTTFAKARFSALVFAKAPNFRVSVVTARGDNHGHGPNLMTGAPRQIKRRTAEYEKGRKKLYVDPG